MYFTENSFLLLFFSLFEVSSSNKEDNFLEEINNTQIVEENKRTFSNSKKQDNKGTIKVIYYNKNQEVKDVCKKHNLSYYNVIEENKNMIHYESVIKILNDL